MFGMPQVPVSVLDTGYTDGRSPLPSLFSSVVLPGKCQSSTRIQATTTSTCFPILYLLIILLFSAAIVWTTDSVFKKVKLSPRAMKAYVGVDV
jgi:hypothetical protein